MLHFYSAIRDTFYRGDPSSVINGLSKNGILSTIHPEEAVFPTKYALITYFALNESTLRELTREFGGGSTRAQRADIAKQNKQSVQAMQEADSEQRATAIKNKKLATKARNNEQVMLQTELEARLRENNNLQRQVDILVAQQAKPCSKVAPVAVIAPKTTAAKGKHNGNKEGAAKKRKVVEVIDEDDSSASSDDDGTEVPMMTKSCTAKKKRHCPPSAPVCHEYDDDRYPPLRLQKSERKQPKPKNRHHLLTVGADSDDDDVSSSSSAYSSTSEDEEQKREKKKKKKKKEKKEKKERKKSKKKKKKKKRKEDAEPPPEEKQPEMKRSRKDDDAGSSYFSRRDVFHIASAAVDRQKVLFYERKEMDDYMKQQCGL